MSTLDTLIKEGIRDDQVLITGVTVTRPALLTTDGTSATYAVDVKLTRQDNVVVNCPIAAASDQLLYAEVNTPVTLQRLNGRLEVIGFAKTTLGTYLRYAVDLSTGDAGSAEDHTLVSRVLTLGELGTVTYAGSSTPVGFGNLPLGAFGVFRGSALLRTSA